MRRNLKTDDAMRGGRPAIAASALALLLATAGTALAQDRPLGPVPVPPENPITEAKRVLGKILFFDEQLSSDDSVACGTCHVMSVGGADPRRAPAAGADGLLGTADDPLGSPGVVAQDATGDFLPDAAFGLGVQVTGRAANPAVMAMYAEDLFWDGRATSTFRDPVSGAVVIAAGGGLESQAVGPPTSSVEMAHAERDWAQIAAKLAVRKPLGLADQLPTDVAAALSGDPTYAALFADAFGDATIDAARIGMAIATYERTLVADQTDWDRFVAGDTSALNAAEQRGLGALRGSECTECHVPPVFSDGSFRNIGVRPVAEDRGRADVTDDNGDRGKFKVPTLRNAALKRSFFHDGRRTTLDQVLRFYANAPGETQFRENQDPIMAQVRVPPPAAADIQAFLAGGLVDARVQQQTFPFDRPVLTGERAERRPRVVTAGRAGAGGVPRMVAPVPAFSGNDEFRVGVHGAAAGSRAFLAISRSVPVGGEVAQTEVVGPLSVLGTGAEGYATARRSLGDEGSGDIYLQWRIEDATAPGGIALSPAVAVTVFAVRGETIGVGGGDDGGDDTGPDVVADDASLLVERASMVVDHDAHADGNTVDRVVLRGAVNPRGADADPTGALLSLEIGGIEVVPPTALDARGRASTSGDAGSIRIRFDAATGTYRISLKNADLRAATGIDGVSGSGDVLLAVSLRIQGLGLATEEAASDLSFAWRTRSGRTGLRYDFDDRGSATGVFRAARVRAKDRSAGRQRVAVRAALDGPGDAGIDVDAGLTLVIGDSAPLFVPASALRVARSGKVSLSGDVAGLRSLTLDARKRTLAISTDDVASGLPDAITGTDTADLAIRVIAGADDDVDAAAFETVVELRRNRRGWRN